ncbi:MAG: hypothetical protein AB8G99_11420 [Planctomycetaceae bacterium]
MTRRVSMLCTVMLSIGSVFAQETKWCDLTGRIVLQGTAPTSVNRPITRDRELFKQSAVPDETLVVNRKNNGVQNVVVFLHSRKSVGAHPSYDRNINAKVELRFTQGRFEPHVLLLRTSQTLLHRSTDPGITYTPRMNPIKNQPQ